MRVLLLGGTTEASKLAAALAGEAGFAVTLSLAGVTSTPRLPRDAPGLECRIGGFGGVEGLCDWLRTARIEALVDATHPYATQITRHAALAAADLGLPYLRIDRPPWRPRSGDRWTRVCDATEAAAALAAMPGTVLLTVGTRSLAAFKDAAGREGPRRRIIVRCIDAPDPGLLPDGSELLLARGPFSLDAELALLSERAIAVLVSKNSGGAATAPKLEAARRLAIPVILIDRPALPAPGVGNDIVTNAEEAHAWLCARRRPGMEQKPHLP